MRIEGHTLAEQDDLSEEFEAKVVAALHRVTVAVALSFARRRVPTLVAVGGPGEVAWLTAAGELDAADAADEVIVLWNAEVPELVSYLDDVYDAGALEAASELAASLPLPPGQGVPGVPDPFVLDYLAGATNRLQSVGNELWDDVRAQLVEGVTRGESVTQLAARIQSTAGFTEGRARRIARTELVAASNAGTHTQVLMIVPTAVKEWVATNDGRTRHTHALADGQRVQVDRTFHVGASLLRFPGDPGGAAGEVVNCRCTLVYDVADDAEPAVTCACGVQPITAAVVNTGSCTCAVTYHDATSQDVTKLTPLQHQQVYAAFMQLQAISPAYGGAKIFKRLQEARAALAADPATAQLAHLTDHELLAVIDELYTGGKKHTFTGKYDEWLASPAGKKASPSPAVVGKKVTGAHKEAPSTPPPAPAPSPVPVTPTPAPGLVIAQPVGQPIPATEVITKTFDTNVNVGDVVAHAVTPNGIPMRAVKLSDGIIKTEYYEHGKWHDNDVKIFSGAQLKAEHQYVQWHAPSAEPPQPPGPVAGPSVVTTHAPTASKKPQVTTSQKYTLLAHFKDPQPVTPGWGGAKVYKQLQVLKTKIASNPAYAGLTDRELLQLLDEVAEHKTSKTYESVVTDWLSTPAGKKYAGGGPEVLDVGGVTVVTPPPPTGVTAFSHDALDVMTPDELGVVADSGIAVTPLELWTEVNIPTLKELASDVIVAVGRDKYGNVVRLRYKKTGYYYETVSPSGYVDSKLIYDFEHFKYVLDFTGVKSLRIPTGTKLFKNTDVIPAPVKTAKKAAKKAVPSPSVQALSQQVGDISQVPSTVQATVVKLFKTGGVGSHSYNDAADVFEHLVNVRKALKAKDGEYAQLSELQILRIVDAAAAKKYNAPYSKFEDKITAWVKTSSGKKTADDILAGKISTTPGMKASKPTASAVSYAKPTTPGLDPKVQATKVPSSTRPLGDIFDAEMKTMMDEMFSQQGAWTAAQRSSLRTYTGSSYSTINRCLRGIGPCNETTLTHIRNIQAGMRRATRRFILHRRTNADEFPGFTHYASFTELQTPQGRTIRLDGFSSTSNGSHAAFGVNVLIEFEIEPGVPMAWVKEISSYKSENEVLLAAGLEGDVTSVTQQGSKTVVRIKVRVP